MKPGGFPGADGDFDIAIDMIETACEYAGQFSHDDSGFIFKHLGVMYAAKYETRELGKQNMTKLLPTEPTARHMNMYASDMIYMIFKKIQDEFEVPPYTSGQFPHIRPVHGNVWDASVGIPLLSTLLQHWTEHSSTKFHGGPVRKRPGGLASIPE